MKTEPAPVHARRIRVRGVVQGVGFRPFIYRIARAAGLSGWVLNGQNGVEIHVEGTLDTIETFVAAIRRDAPPAAQITDVAVQTSALEPFAEFVIRESEKNDRPTVRVSPDLPACKACLREMRDPADRRYRYPYINCTDCGPRYSIVRGLPYDRPLTTMRDWPMCASCRAEYDDPGDRRFHAQPVACSVCGPTYTLMTARWTPGKRGPEAVEDAARMLRAGAIVGVKGLGGYHLACDAHNPRAVAQLRERKFRRERPFALMVRDVATARGLVDLSPESEALLDSVRRPIVLAQALVQLHGIAPDNRELGIMLPYTPVHHLLFDAGAPDVLVMTSANRSSEPIAYTDEDARARLVGVGDAFLVGEREIARRMDDSVVRSGPFGPIVLRHARGYAPGVVATLPAAQPILAVGADLKNAVTLVVDGQAIASQHVGDLEHQPSIESFRETVHNLCAMYEVALEDLLVAHDLHPEYVSTQFARALPGRHVAVQHHRAHVASVLAERAELDTRVLGISFDGTGYGDDASIWGGEAFVGSVAGGFERVAKMRSAVLAGGDAAARFPVQAAAGFLVQLGEHERFLRAPFAFPERYRRVLRLIEAGIRLYPTTSIGRLFDAVAALLGFTREMTFEGQAAMWLENVARSSPIVAPYAFPLRGGELDFRPLLAAIVTDRLAGREEAEIAYAFHAAIAEGIIALAEAHAGLPIVASGGVFQNALLLELLHERLADRLWVNRVVPPNDGGISLGQSALASFAQHA